MSEYHLFNPYTKPVVDNRPKYLIDRDKREARESAEYDKEESDKIMSGILKKEDENEFYKSPADYEAGKLEGKLSSIVSKI
tara:strand:+ start:336 stop:578 length:243 start_codon:yes stop_codon:yes gene_type:complete